MPLLYFKWHCAKPKCSRTEMKFGYFLKFLLRKNGATGYDELPPDMLQDSMTQI